MLSPLLTLKKLCRPSLGGVLLLALASGCQPDAGSEDGTTAAAKQGKSAGSAVATELPQQTVFLVEQFCGNCHPTPAPSSFPKSNWPAEVERGFGFYFESGRQDLQMPRMVDAIQYFQSRAPEKIDLPSADSFATGPTRTRFQPGPLLLSGDKISLTADIKFDATSQSVFFSDMANARLRRLKLDQFAQLQTSSSKEQVTLPGDSAISEGNHLCKMTQCDWNGDGMRDYMIAEIGSMIISDQRLGSVAVYLSQPDDTFQRVVLAEKLARPVEAVPLDYDEDGDLDVLVAEFGYNKAGCLSLLRNQAVHPTDSRDAGASEVTVLDPNLRYEVVDPRHGHLAVILADVCGDRKLDIITALGQEYETVQVRCNLGQGQYDSHVALVLSDLPTTPVPFKPPDIDGDGWSTWFTRVEISLIVSYPSPSMVCVGSRTKGKVSGRRMSWAC